MMPRYWKETEGDERADAALTWWPTGEDWEVSLVGPFEGLLVPGSREQAVERMLDTGFLDKWTPDGRKHAALMLLAAALGEQETP